MKRIYAPNRIREIRKSRKMSMEALAALVEPEVTMATIHKLETSQMGLTLDYMKEIAKALNVPIEELIHIDKKIMRYVPLILQDDAQNWQSNVIAAEEQRIVPDNLEGLNLFDLEPDGEDMQAILPNGGFVVIDPDQQHLLVDKLYLILNDQGATQFRRYHESPPRLAHPSDKNQPALNVGQKPFLVIGRVVYVGAKI